MKFEKDIFISYAHLDDESLVESQNGWITEFHRVLSIRLGQVLGRKPVIWRDLELHGNHIFDQQIVDQFSQVAIMISIITPRYTKSDWCIREVNEFYAACKKNIGFNVNNQGRIFKIIKTPVKVEQHPEIIQNILGYEFFTTDPNSGRIRELAQISGQPTDRLYWDKLDDIANDIATFLESIETQDDNTSSGNPQSQDTEKLKIYLAESSYETKELRDNLRRELQNSGCEIFPNKQLPFVENALVENVTTLLDETELAIHLIGENYGLIPEGTQKSIVEIQNDVAASISNKKGLQRLIWLPEGLQPKEERQKSFVNNIKDGTNGIEGADVIVSSLESFKEIILDKITSIKNAKIKEEPPVIETVELKEQNVTTTNNNKSDLKGIVYLIHDLLDIDEIREIENYLFQNGFEVLVPLFEGDESDIRNDHIENLKICDAAIVYYGKANELWLRSKMRDFLKISGYGREKPIAVKAIYLGGPSTSAKEQFRSLGTDLINGLSEFPSASLEKLFLNL
jgi:hypothetical protein